MCSTRTWPTRSRSTRRCSRRSTRPPQSICTGGAAPAAGQLVKCSDLARTFRKLVEAEDTAAASGRPRQQALRAAFDRFYKGDIAREMSPLLSRAGRALQARGLRDLRADLGRAGAHDLPRHDIYSSPSTSRGGLEVTMQLNLIEGFDLAALGHNSAAMCASRRRVDQGGEVGRLPFRRRSLRNRGFDRRAPVEGVRRAPTCADSAGAGDGLPGSRHASKSSDDPRREGSVDRSGRPLSAAILAAPRASRSSIASATSSSPHRLSVVGRGTGVVVGSTGLIFNNGARHGSTSPYPDDANYARAGQIPILNNSPTLVMKDGKFYMSLGTPGGETIG